MSTACARQVEAQLSPSPLRTQGPITTGLRRENGIGDLHRLKSRGRSAAMSAIAHARGPCVRRDDIEGVSSARRACLGKPPADAHRQSVADFAIGLQLLLAIAFGAG